MRIAGGFNSRLDEMQAALLRVGLRRLDADNAERQRLADRYLSRLRVPALPCSRPDSAHVYHLFVVRHPNRDVFREEMRRRGVETLVHYPMPVHLQPAYAHLGGRPGELRETEGAAREVVSLPLFPGLPEDQQDMVMSAVNAAAVVERSSTASAQSATGPEQAREPLEYRPGTARAIPVTE